MYRGRFAPSPTGELHAGSLVAALASYLDARAHQGEWWVRMEDIDGPRCAPGADQIILQQLQRCGLQWDGEIAYQSQRNSLYQGALDQLLTQGLVYPCGCTRKEIEESQALMGLNLERHKAAVYPGTCRDGLQGKSARAWRFNVQAWSAKRGSPWVHWTDRRLGAQTQNVLDEVGDFVLKRADGLWAYQLAVVVDDAAQGISHVVRGQDLTDNTARQIMLHEALGLPQPVYMHTPLVLGANGEKLSKQNGAKALDLSSEAAVCQAMNQAAAALELDTRSAPLNSLAERPSVVAIWAALWAQREATKIEA
ncbi:MAG: tRNA glutamyl-Q(34) synthetase GluQRS [Pseudomonadota bacterium]|nr:tRNA glutamyl-Q(34) synthetase GluQRS [Pseudomonadota bacterium]